MARKVIIDCDPGIGDAIALCLALFEPELEVLAVTAVEGIVSAKNATRNVQAVLEQLDSPRLPRLGAAASPDTVPPVSSPTLFGDDGLGGVDLPVSQLHHQHEADKIICDELRAAPNEVTIITLGPLTNIARAFTRDPEVESLVGQFIIVGGTVTAPGDVAPIAELNIAYDPQSARTVFRSATTKTIVPLDVSRGVLFRLGQMDEIPCEENPASRFIRRLLPLSFRAHHQGLGIEGIYLPAAIGVILALHPELFETEELSGDVETAGDLTMGATIFDRRPHARPGNSMDVALKLNAAAVTDEILRRLARAGQGDANGG